jgi:FtsZ-binding cell division protein ZapB
MKKSFTYYATWAIYMGLLAVMLPHTQWGFRQLEPADSVAVWRGWALTWASVISAAAALAFEGGVAVFTHRLARKIETVKKVYKTGKDGARAYDRLGTFLARYGNSFTAALLFCAFISGIANYFHALQYSGDLVAFSKIPLFRDLYPLALGAALPVISLVFANALSNVSEEETEEDPALVELKEKNKELNRVNRELSQQFSKLQTDFSGLQETFSRVQDELQTAKAATEEVKALQDRLNNVPEAARALSGEPKEAILFLKQNYPTLPNASIAILAGVSPGRVTQVIKDYSLPVERSVTNATETASPL